MTQILISVGGIAVTVALAWLLGFRRTPVLADADSAQRLAAEMLHGFRPVTATLDSGGRAARVTGSDGRVATIRALGDRWVVGIAP